MLLTREVRVGNGVGGSPTLRNPLRSTGGTLRLFPLVVVQGFEVAVVPLGWRGCPRAFETTRDGVVGVARPHRVVPAETHLLEGCALWLGADVLARVTGAVRLAERVSSDDECRGLFVVHGHAAERLANVACRTENIGVAGRAFWVDVDETHLNCGKWILEVAFTFVTSFIGEPLGLLAPVGVVWFPDIGATATETEGFESHVFEGNVADENHEVSPREGLSVLLLDRPEQTTSLVEVHIVRPAVERSETLQTHACSTATVGGAVRSGAVPCETNEERTVVSVVGRPPVLRVRHEVNEVGLDRGEVERGERLGVLELLT